MKLIFHISFMVGAEYSGDVRASASFFELTECTLEMSNHGAKRNCTLGIITTSLVVVEVYFGDVLARLATSNRLVMLDT